MQSSNLQMGSCKVKILQCQLFVNMEHPLRLSRLRHSYGENSSVEAALQNVARPLLPAVQCRNIHQRQADRYNPLDHSLLLVPEAAWLRDRQAASPAPSVEARRSSLGTTRPRASSSPEEPALSPVTSSSVCAPDTRKPRYVAGSSAFREWAFLVLQRSRFETGQT